MSSPQKIDIELGKLLVNSENYRFKRVMNQQEAMLMMLHSQNSKLVKLAKDIAQHGLSPMERLLVKEAGNSKYIVLEGNRRITALKLMTNPNEIPGNYPFKSTFENLHVECKDSLPTVVECAVYLEDQQSRADRWVLLKHTGENQGMGTVSWNSMQKQRFSSQYTQRRLSRALQVLEFLEAKGIDTVGVGVTNLERVLSTAAVRQELGIDFPNKELLLTELEQDVLQRLEKVVQHMGAKDFAVGQIYKVPQKLEWLKKVIAPNTSTPSSSKHTDTLHPASSNSDISTPTPKSAPLPSLNNDAVMSQTPTSRDVPNTPTPSQPSSFFSSVNPSSYPTLIKPRKQLPATSSTNTKIAEIYKELQTVNVSQAPHAVGALFRILVEITAQDYLMQKKSFIYDGSDNFRNPIDMSKTYNELRQKLDYIAKHCELPRDLAKMLKILNEGQLLTPTLNQLMHSTIFTVGGTTIKELWKNFEKVFDHLINEMQ